MDCAIIGNTSYRKDSRDSELAELTRRVAPRHSNADRVLQAQLAWCAERRNAGQSLFMVTTTYNEPKGGELTVQLANRNLDRAWRRLLEYVLETRHFERPKFRRIQPWMMAFIDVPGSKPKSEKAFGVPIHESRFHHHSILACGPEHAVAMAKLIVPFWRDKFAKDFRLREACYVRSFHVRAFEDATMGKAVDYVTWHARRFFGRPEWDGLLSAFGGGLAAAVAQS